MKSMNWLRLVALLSAISCANAQELVRQHQAAQQKVAQSQEAAQDYQSTLDWIDNELDQIRAAPKDATQRLDNQLAVLETLVTRQPNNAAIHLMLGRARILRDCAFGVGNCGLRAKTHLTKAIELDPKLVRAHVLLAHDAMNSGCLPCAEHHIGAAMQLEAASPYVLEANARRLQMMGRLDQAEALYLKALDAFPKPIKRYQAYAYLSAMYRQRDDYDRAEIYLLKAFQLAPDGAWAIGDLGTFYIFVRGDYERAIPVLRRAVSIMSYRAAQEGLALALYERWADAYLSNVDGKRVAAFWEEAQAASPDAKSMFLESANYIGTGRATRALLKAGKVPRSMLDQPWEQGRTALVMATWNDNTDLAVFLLQHGANPDARDENGFYPAHIAGSYANLAIIQALARKNANLHALTPEARETVLMQVARTGKGKPDSTKLAKLLIDKGVAVNAKSAQGSTALSYAIGARDIEMVRYLLSRGAKVNDDLWNGRTPLAYAIEVGDRDVVQELINNKADRSVKVSGLGLPEFAVKNRRPELADLLR